jgi:hypothetical protein
MYEEESQQSYGTANAGVGPEVEGLPITEYLPEGHEGREVYGLIRDPTPDKGRALGRVQERQRPESSPRGNEPR